MEKLLSRNKKAYIAFLDLQAAFDTIPREIIWKALQKLGVTKISYKKYKVFMKEYGQEEDNHKK